MTGDAGDTLYIGSAEMCEALSILLAAFLKRVPKLGTPRDIRTISDTVAKKLRLSIAEISEHRAGTDNTASIYRHTVN